MAMRSVEKTDAAEYEGVVTYVSNLYWPPYRRLLQLFVISTLFSRPA